MVRQQRLRAGIVAIVAAVGISVSAVATPAAAAAPGAGQVATADGVTRVYLGTQPTLAMCQALGRAWMDRIVAYQGYVCEPVAGGYALYMLIYRP